MTGGGFEPQVTESSYDFLLPRFNLVVEPVEDIIIRGGVARDIRRPNFDQLSSSVSFNTSSNDSVQLGNPALEPESVWSFDLSGEYYFSPASLVSVGFFHKIREGLFTSDIEAPASNTVDGQVNVSIDPSCPDGGIFNPIGNFDNGINNPNVDQSPGICVPRNTTFNGAGETTQTGIELAFQHDLSGWEDRLGWASGFGFIGNYTYQKQGGNATDFASNFLPLGERRDIFEGLGLLGTSKQFALPNLSENSYNLTLFYEKFGLSARARYTWRSSFDSLDDDFFGVQIVSGSRGQLNASVNYDINDHINIGVEGINLTREDLQQFCVNDGALLCFQNLSDRRLIGGINVKF